MKPSEPRVVRNFINSCSPIVCSRCDWLLWMRKVEQRSCLVILSIIVYGWRIVGYLPIFLRKFKLQETFECLLRPGRWLLHFRSWIFACDDLHEARMRSVDHVFLSPIKAQEPVSQVSFFGLSNVVLFTTSAVHLIDCTDSTSAHCWLFGFR